MRLIDADELLRVADSMPLTDDGGIDYNEFVDLVNSLNCWTPEELLTALSQGVGRALDDAILYGVEQPAENGGVYGQIANEEER